MPAPAPFHPLPLVPMPFAPFLQVSSLVDLHSGGDALPLADDGLFVPDWVLDVQGVQQAQVRGAGDGCRRGRGPRGRVGR